MNSGDLLRSIPLFHWVIPSEGSERDAGRGGISEAERAGRGTARVQGQERRGGHPGEPAQHIGRRAPAGTVVLLGC